MRLFGGNKNIIGVDIGSSAIKVCQLSQAKGGGHGVVTLGIEPLPHQTIVEGSLLARTAVSNAITKLFKDHRIKGRNVAISVPCNLLIVKKLELPLLEEDELEETIYWEAREFLPFDIDDIYFDYQIHDHKTNPTEVLLVGVQRHKINDYLDLLLQLRLNPIIVDLDVLAMQNAFVANCYPNPNEVIALVNIGLDIISIAICQDGKFEFLYSGSSDGSKSSEDMQKGLHLSYEQDETVKPGIKADRVSAQDLQLIPKNIAIDIITNIQKRLDYFMATTETKFIHRLLFTGDMPEITVFQDLFSDQLGINAEIINPFLRVATNEKKNISGVAIPDANLYAVAVGLALRHPLDKRINLLRVSQKSKREVVRASRSPGLGLERIRDIASRYGKRVKQPFGMGSKSNETEVEYESPESRQTHGTLGSTRKARPELPSGVLDKVNFSVAAPPTVAPGSSFIVHVLAYLAHQRQLALELAREAFLDSKIQIYSKGPVLVSRGTFLTVRLIIEGLIIEDPMDIVLWDQEIGNATFAVRVPEEIIEGAKLGRVTIHVNGLQIAKIDFSIQISLGPQITDNLVFREQHHRKAFASYAREDRNEVLARIQGLQKAAPHMEIFLDVLALRSGQNWEQELWEKIPSSDIFYLFWSKNAQKSEWVEKEWRCALQTKGLDFIDPVPLISPEEVPPPRELAAKHFNDWVLAFMSKT